jgi:hypothetical protein
MSVYTSLAYRVNRYRTYTISALAAQKLAAMDDQGGRIKPRDLEDIRFLTERYGADLDESIRTSIADLVADGGVALANKYRHAYVIDEERSEDDLTATVLSLLAYRDKCTLFIPTGSDSVEAVLLRGGRANIRTLERYRIILRLEGRNQEIEHAPKTWISRSQSAHCPPGGGLGPSVP